MQTIPHELRSLFGEGMSVHGLLASFLARGGPAFVPYKPWRATWPSWHDFQKSMPILWEGSMSPSYGLRLPPAIGGSWAIHDNMAITQRPERVLATGLLERQRSKLEDDWAKAKRGLCDVCKDTFTYYWLIVNTRSFYFELPGLTRSQASHDRMVLCPIIDYFNHDEFGCEVSFSESGFAVLSDRIYEPGEELRTSYGRHSNDFLLVECGRWHSFCRPLPTTD